MNQTTTIQPTSAMRTPAIIAAASALGAPGKPLFRDVIAIFITPPV